MHMLFMVLKAGLSGGTGSRVLRFAFVQSFQGTVCLKAPEEHCGCGVEIPSWLRAQNTQVYISGHTSRKTASTRDIGSMHSPRKDATVSSLEEGRMHWPNVNPYVAVQALHLAVCRTRSHTELMTASYQ